MGSRMTPSLFVAGRPDAGVAVVDVDVDVDTGAVGRREAVAWIRRTPSGRSQISAPTSALRRAVLRSIGRTMR